MEVPRRIRCLYCSSILLQLRGLVSPRNSSSSVTVALVAQWRGNGGFGWSARMICERGRDSEGLVLSL